MAVKKTTKSPAKKTTAKKPASRKAASAAKSPSKSASTKAASKKAAPKKKTAAVKKTTATQVKPQAKPQVKPVTNQAVKTAKDMAEMFAMPFPQLKEMEKIMTTNQPFQFDQMAQEAANQGRENMEAFVKSGTIFAKGFEEIMQAAAAISQTAAEKQAEFAKQLMGSKTLNELAEAQNKIAQANFDQFMAGATKLSEMGVKVLSESAEPLNAQMTKAMKKANKSMAA